MHRMIQVSDFYVEMLVRCVKWFSMLWSKMKKAEWCKDIKMVLNNIKGVRRNTSDDDYSDTPPENRRGKKIETRDSGKVMRYDDSDDDYSDTPPERKTKKRTKRGVYSSSQPDIDQPRGNHNTKLHSSASPNLQNRAQRKSSTSPNITRGTSPTVKRNTSDNSELLRSSSNLKAPPPSNRNTKRRTRRARTVNPKSSSSSTSPSYTSRTYFLDGEYEVGLQ